MTTPLPFHTLEPTLFGRAQSLLDEDWLKKDTDLAPVLPVVLARGVGQDWHKAGTFRHHLVGVCVNWWAKPPSNWSTCSAPPAARSSRSACWPARSRPTAA